MQSLALGYVVRKQTYNPVVPDQDISTDAPLISN